DILSFKYDGMKKILLLFLLFPVLDSYAQKWEKNYESVDNCICGLSKVKKNGKIGYVNKDGDVIIKVIYDEGLTFNEGYTAVRLDMKWMYFDSTGRAVTEAIYEDAYSFSGGLAPVAQNNQYGFINSTGQLVIPFQFSNARGFTEGLAPAANAKGFWGFINTKGEWVIKPAYDFTGNFEEGEARVIKDNKVMYIDHQGKVLRQ
ncbi:MAG TPA: WG repeat-containing protein, partial [Ferruginibacter sp.]|nr:WG repeat-containing protein [Ferruginibacter sp.]HNL65890.1 WG repeat-containing protein [Ferruginibacter sp.]HNP00119.1 WG repeat-containing protein [Ferruginibacter sp.]